MAEGIKAGKIQFTRCLHCNETAQETALQVRDLGLCDTLLKIHGSHVSIPATRSCHSTLCISKDGNVENSFNLPCHNFDPALAGGYTHPSERLHGFIPLATSTEQLWWLLIDVTSRSFNAPTKTH